MFSASDYVQKRYANAKVPPTELVVQRLQALVDASGLTGHAALVEVVLNALTPPNKLTALYLDSIRVWLKQAAAIRELGGQWEKALVEYAAGRDAEGLEVNAFFQSCLGTELLPLQHAADGAIATTAPLVIIGAPAIKTEIATGRRGSIGYVNKNEITIGMGLFEIVAGFQAPTGYRGPSKMGILQFATSDRVAVYSDGTKISRVFPQVLDSDSDYRPWLGGAMVRVAPTGTMTALVAHDGPKWNLPLEDDAKRHLVSVAVNDSFTTHVVLETGPGTYTKLYTCGWTFTAAYSAADPAAATQSYTVLRKGPSNGEIRLTGQEQLANLLQDQVSK